MSASESVALTATGISVRNPSAEPHEAPILHLYRAMFGSKAERYGEE
jgi:hypothetical protein